MDLLRVEMRVGALVTRQLMPRRTSVRAGPCVARLSGLRTIRLSAVHVRRKVVHHGLSGRFLVN